MKATEQTDWHPDINTGVVWTPHMRKREVLHYAKATGLSLLLGTAGFLAAVLVAFIVRAT